MVDVSLEEMLDAGAHFGHQTRKWNPKMRPFIYGARSGIHILDLGRTRELAVKAFNAIEEIVAHGGEVLFVGTKKQAQGVIEEEAKRAGQPYVTRRWMGGTLTNFGTIRKSVEKLIELETRRAKDDFAGYTKREILGIDREINKLEAALGGIKQLKRPPSALFVVDPVMERIAVHEANVLSIPVVAVTDSNCDPDPINYPIPANDDSIKSIRIFASRMADAILAGLEKKEAIIRMEENTKQGKGKERVSRKAREMAGSGRAYVSKVDTFEENKEVDSFSATVTPEGGEGEEAEKEGESETEES